MRFQTLNQWLDWQSTLHPSEIELGLSRVKRVWERINRDRVPFKVITVAGTNGKGSCVAMLAAMLQAGGYLTGSYTSPHLIRYNERIRVDGEEADDESICRAFECVDRARGEDTLTYFEFGTLAALEIFCRQRIDVAILEVGLGGRLDAVNILDADVALITTIGIDHTEWLGGTREQIALEKAGIMRPGRPAVCGEMDPPDSLIEQAQALDARLYLAGRDFGYRTGTGQWYWHGPERSRHALPMPALRGPKQLENAAATLMALETLHPDMPLDQRAVRSGLQSAIVPGRFQVVSGAPVVVLDVAHNPQAVGVLAANLREIYCAGRTYAVFSLLSGKDLPGVVAAIDAQIDHWYLGELETERALSTAQLLQGMSDAGIPEQRMSGCGNADQAYARAMEQATEEDRILVFGSFYLVGRILDIGTPIHR